MPLRFRRWLWLAAFIPLLPAWWIYQKAERAKAEAGSEAAANGRLAFTLKDFHPLVPTGIQQLLAAPGLRDIAALNGRVFVSAATGLYAYDGEHAVPQFWRAGIELPPAELGPLATAVLGGSGSRELIAATSGEGLLFFDGVRFRRLLPENRSSAG